MARSAEHHRGLKIIPSTSNRHGTPEFSIVSKEGEVIDQVPHDQTLDDLRDFSREYGGPLDRLDLWQSELDCTRCSTSIDDRFSATANDELLCFECAMDRGEDTDSRDVTHTTDPTKAVLSNSALHHKNLCNYVINVATGCSHGCKFCYVPSTPNVKMRQEMLDNQVGVKDGQKEWGSYLLYRDDLPERLGRKLDRKQIWENKDGGRGVVMISSGTDCYQDRRTSQITRECVIELVNHNKKVRILTRSPAVVRDIDVFQAADGQVTVGSSIPCLNDQQVRAIEPGAPAPSARLRALEQISHAGVPVYVSMSPTYPTQEREDLRELLKTFKKRLDPDVVFHEPINPRGANFEMTVKAAKEAGQTELASELEDLRNRDKWVNYSVDQLTAVESLGEELGVPVHLWPDKELLNYVEGEEKDRLNRERNRPETPEQFPRVPASG